MLGMRRMCGYFGFFIRLVVGHPTDRLAICTRAGADYNSTSKGAAASCGWSDKTALQCKNVNDQDCAAFGEYIYRAK